MKKAILILLTVLLAVSCSQVVYDKLPPESLNKDETILTVEQIPNSRNILLRFEPVPYVSSYGYSINGNSVIEDFVPDYDNGVFTFQINEPELNGVIDLYGSTKNTGWSLIGQASYNVIVDGVAPDAYVYARYENSVDVKIDPISDIPTKYKIVLKNGNNTISETEYEQEADNIYEVQNIESDMTYTLEISQWSFVNNAYSTNTKQLGVEAFENDVRLNMVKNDDSFVVSVPSQLSGTVYLMKGDTQLAEETVSDGEVVFNFNDLKSLEIGLFYAKLDNYVSNNVEALIPLNIVKSTVNYKSVDFVIDLADDIEKEQLKLAVIGAPGSTISDPTEINGKTVITISALDSNSEYSISIRVMYNEESVLTVLDTFTTQAFDGFYEWKGYLKEPSFGTKGDDENANFRIWVEKAPENSIYPYYVFFSSNDKVFSENEELTYTEYYQKSDLRIMPLVDTLIGEPITSTSNRVDWGSGISQDGQNMIIQNKAYQTNSQKWNASSSTPVNWFINTPDANSSKDIVTTETTSKAGIPGLFMSDQQTNTTFSFCETRDEEYKAVPYIKFKNIGAPGSLVGLGLYTNNDENECEKFNAEKDSDPQYCWYLSLVDLSEGGAK